MASAAGHASIGSALSLQLLPRMVVTLVVAAAALLGLAAIMPSFDLSGFGAAVGLAAVGVELDGLGSAVVLVLGLTAHPFVLAPAAWPWPAGGVVGAEAVHHLLRGWLARLGHEAYAEPVKA
jgi:hypothetical protein